MIVMSSLVDLGLAMITIATATIVYSIKETQII